MHVIDFEVHELSVAMRCGVENAYRNVINVVSACTSVLVFTIIRRFLVLDETSINYEYETFPPDNCNYLPSMTCRMFGRHLFRQVSAVEKKSVVVYNAYVDVLRLSRIRAKAKRILIMESLVNTSIVSNVHDILRLSIVNSTVGQIEFENVTANYTVMNNSVILSGRFSTTIFEGNF